MPPYRRKRLALIHIIKTQLGLQEAAYRSILLKTTGVNSAAKIKNDCQYFALLKALRAFGASEGANETNPNRCSERQLYYIQGLWKLAARNKTDKGLNAFIKRITGIERMCWLTRANATKVILALKAMAREAGFNPDTVPNTVKDA